MSEYCEDINKVFNIEKAKLAARHAKEGHSFVSTDCLGCDESVCYECLVDVVRVHDIGISGQCPFCGFLVTYCC